MDMINVVKFESISFKVTNEVSLYNNWQLLEICISFGVLSVVSGSGNYYVQRRKRAIAEKPKKG